MPLSPLTMTGHQDTQHLAPRLYNLFHKTQLSMEFIMLTNVKMPTIVGILTFISRINAVSESFKARKYLFFNILVFMSS